jgi:glutamine cyclotransferase
VSNIFCVTDGSEYLHFWDTGFREIPSRPRLPVKIETLVVAMPDGRTDVVIPPPGRTLRNINELEWDAATNTLLANMWFEEVVLRIDPTSGVVTHVYDFSTLYPRQSRQAAPEGYHTEDVFNGIAIVPHTDGKEWLVTGKYWPSIYWIRLGD